MTSLFLAFFILLQGIPTQQGGKVTGVLRDSLGRPLAGVRMAAVARGASLEQIATEGTSMAGLTETDEQGRFVLEDIPPGRYSIAAGRLDLQTFYPGTQSIVDARVLTVAAGETLAGVDFTLNDTSSGRTQAGITRSIQASIPVRVAVEGAGKLPVSAEGKLVVVRLESTSLLQAMPITRGYFLVPGPVATDFRVTVENLPETHEVKSMAYGATAIPQGVFHLTAANFPTMPPPVPGSISSISSSLTSLAGQLLTVASAAPLQPAQTPPSTLLITIGEVARPSAGGVRVSGRTGIDGRRIYLSGKPGVVFSDGSFEFRDVAPGRHLIVSSGASGPLANVVVVGDQNLGGIELKEINILPDDARDPKDPRPAGDLSPGSVVPLVRLRGTVIEESTQVPITQGEMIIGSGDSSRTIPIDEKGRFETFSLLPGVYDLKLQIFGHATSGSTVVVDDKDLELRLTTRRLY